MSDDKRKWRAVAIPLNKEAPDDDGTLLRDFAANLERTVNELMDEGRDCGINFTNRGAIVMARLSQAAKMEQLLANQELETPAFEACKRTKEIIGPVMHMLERLPPTPRHDREFLMKSIFDSSTVNVSVADLNKAAEDCERIVSDHKKSDPDCQSDFAEVMTKLSTMLRDKARDQLQ